MSLAGKILVNLINLMCEGSWVNSEEGDEVAAEEGELEADLGHVVRVHRQRLSNTLDEEENIDVKGNDYLGEDEYDDADSKADDDQTEKIIFLRFQFSAGWDKICRF